MNGTIDLRSDTVTRPSPEMLKAMTAAPVGDDVFGEDPSVNLLEEMAADMLGHEAALFVPSGTMANQIAIKILTSPGEEVLLNGDSHPFVYECGAAAVLGGVMLRPLPGERGLLDPDLVESEIRPDDIHYAPTRLVCLENTHNRGGGSVYPLATIERIREIALARGLVTHMDGARLFNACQATGHAPWEYARHFETISFCLSKGLGAPVGSLLVSNRDLIREARQWRKRLGGGMRQVGILAAAGIYALNHNVSRLSVDHENARILAKGLRQIDGLDVALEDVETNIVIFHVDKPQLGALEFTAMLAKQGVLSLPFGRDSVRMVTHLDVNDQDIRRALKIMASILE